MSSIFPDQPNELVLTESRTMRAATAGRVDVLDRVKALSLLPDGVHATTEIVASYYEVDAEAIKKTVQRNREELEQNGLRKISGDEFRSFVRDTLSPANEVSSKTRSLNLFTRRTILNVGQLLTESEVAKAVRTYLLDVEETATPEHRMEALERVELATSRIRMLKEADGYVDPAWQRLKIAHQAAYGLGEEPETDPAERPLYVPDFLKSKGLSRADITSEQSWFGRRAASLYEAEHGDKPGKRTEETTRGSIRETFAWVERDRPFFEDAWNRWYAAKYPTAPVQGELGGAA